MSAAGAVHEHQAHGFSVYWGEAPGPFTARLIFRVGRADERLPTAGITHLVEHLALPAGPARRVEFNGMVDGTETMFAFAGPREGVLDLLGRTVSLLGSLPLERLEIERRILETEAASTGRGLVGHAAFLRFGAQGHGLTGIPQYGLRWLGADQIQAWSTERFTRGNVAVCLTGPPPNAFDLDLPAGARLPPPAAEPIDYLRFPCAIDGGPPGVVAVSLLVRRSAEFSCALAIADRRLEARLRYEQGLSYEVSSWYEPLTLDFAQVLIKADTLEDQADRVRAELLAVLDDLAETGPSAGDLADEVDDVRSRIGDPAQIETGSVHAARRALLGAPFESAAKRLRATEAVTPEASAVALREALSTLLLIVPEGVSTGGLTPYPMTSPILVEGRRHRIRGLRQRRLKRRVSLIAGTDGLMLEEVDGARETVVFGDCVALLRWVDGTRGLWSRDGFYVEVSPDLWREGEKIVCELDERLPAELVVPMDRELEERIEEVERAVGDSVSRNWLTSVELDALPLWLQRDERVVAVSRADRGMQAGLLAVTDRRVLFLYFDEVELELPRAAVTGVREQPETWRDDRKLVIESGGAEHVFGLPVERLSAFVRTLEG
jgi:zinc protease